MTELDKATRVALNDFARLHVISRVRLKSSEHQLASVWWFELINFQNSLKNDPECFLWWNWFPTPLWYFFENYTFQFYMSSLVSHWLWDIALVPANVGSRFLWLLSLQRVGFLFDKEMLVKPSDSKKPLDNNIFNFSISGCVHQTYVRHTEETNVLLQFQRILTELVRATLNDFVDCPGFQVSLN